MNKKMNSLQRVLTTLGHHEPDRVPQFLLLTMHGAKELDMPIEKYFSKAEYVIKGQLKLQKKYLNDCFYPFFYAPLEVEAFGAEVIYVDDGPPNSGEPLISNLEAIFKLEPPSVKDSKVLLKVLETIAGIKKHAKDEVPIVGVVMSPFSLPVMQLGFEAYLQMMHYRKDLFDQLMRVNTRFCTDWANAQLAAGATAICYFDPVSSPSMITPEMYQETGLQVAKNTIGGINGPTATHFASGKALPVLNEVVSSGTAVIGISAHEDLAQLKEASAGKISLLGNLNGIEMRTWDHAKTTQTVKDLIDIAAPGGGFILSDNHGEIPYQVEEDTLHAISETVLSYGTY